MAIAEDEYMNGNHMMNNNMNNIQSKQMMNGNMMYLHNDMKKVHFTINTMLNEKDPKVRSQLWNEHLEQMGQMMDKDFTMCMDK